MSEIVRGVFYNSLTIIREGSDEFKKCIEETVVNLLETETNADRPGMLLGKIQSGKTRAFLGVIALAFDNQFDISIILTKGTKALAKQTYSRLKEAFAKFIKDDEVQICDIMHLPDNLTRFERSQKLIIVVKKQTHNMARIIKALVETYPDLGQKKILIVDDEADNASVGYKSDKENDGVIQMNKIARQINELRQKVGRCGFLQVTATPYSLYLQPDEIRTDSPEVVFKPIRPAFTVLLPTYHGYIGGDLYFEGSDSDDAIANFIFEEVPREEFDTIRREDRRSFRLEEALTSRRISVLRSAIVNFIVAACVRRLQQEQSGQKPRKYSFIVHTEASRGAHAWQERIVESIKDSLLNCISHDQGVLNGLLERAYLDIQRSVAAMCLTMPDFQSVREKAYNMIQDDHIMIAKVNSERQVEELLDDAGQLRLRTPLNIFIGGQILDRGLTIDNLIGFYYGRRPNRYQQDTVLQHSRMYGNRPKDDLAVTRFYTAQIIYDAMARIHVLDGALRDAFQRGAQSDGVIFIHADDSHQVIPCSPNKILISTTTTLSPNTYILPVGFQVKYKTHISKKIEEIDRCVDALHSGRDVEQPIMVDLGAAKKLIGEVYSTYEIDEDVFVGGSLKELIASMDFLSNGTANMQCRGKVLLAIRRNRSAARFKGGNRFENSPYSKQEQSLAQRTAIDVPLLMLFRQAGEEEKGWRGHPFWWPVVVTPQNMPTVIFANDTI